MEFETLDEFTGSTDHAQIVRGKRSKRPRTSSPFGVAVTSSSSSGGGGGGGSDVGGVYFSVPSPTTSAEVSEEEEDMANCLIMLAQSGCPREEIKTAAAATAVKAGFNIYDCKTCNRTFPSFQALGGHRASHKRPKAMMLEKRENGNEEKEEGQFRKNNIIPLALSLHTDNKAKVHECSICGAEFASGQALGGHMRRHRNPNTPRIGTSVDSSTIEESHEGEKPRRKILSLDLNLPAPEDDHSKFQQHLVFSSPSLVDCHY